MKKTYTFLKNNNHPPLIEKENEDLVISTLAQDRFTETTILAIATNLSLQVIEPILLQLKTRKKVSDRYQFKKKILWREWKLT